MASQTFLLPVAIYDTDSFTSGSSARTSIKEWDFDRDAGTPRPAISSDLLDAGDTAYLWEINLSTRTTSGGQVSGSY